MGEGDAKAVNDLFNRTFRKKRSLREWEWKFMRNPAGSSVCAVCEEDEKIVGFLGGLPMKFKAGRGEVMAYLGVDLCVDEGYRNRKISHEIITEELSRIASVIYGFRDEENRNIYSRVSDRELFSLPLPKLTLDISRGLRDVPFMFLSGISGSLFRERRIVEVKSFGPEYDDLWRRASADIHVAVIRDSSYLNWRFVEKPGNNYVIFSWVGGGVVKGYIVLDSCMGEGVILDMLTIRDPEVVGGLIRRAVSFFKMRGFKKVGFSSTDKYLLDAFRRYGFSESTFGVYLIAYTASSGGDMDWVRRLDEWFVTASDDDCY